VPIPNDCRRTIAAVDRDRLAGGDAKPDKTAPEGTGHIFEFTIGQYAVGPRKGQFVREAAGNLREPDIGRVFAAEVKRFLFIPDTVVRNIARQGEVGQRLPLLYLPSHATASSAVARRERKLLAG